MTKSKVIVITLAAFASLVAIFNWPAKKSGTVDVSEIPIPKINSEVETIEVAIAEPEPICTQEAQELAYLKPISLDEDLPVDVDRMQQLFQPYPPLLSFVETVSFSSKVDWVAGRPAYLGDYASHYQTSKHFISRSLHGMGHYLSDTVSKGNRFNVFRLDKQIEFHLVLDLSRLKMWLFCYHIDENQKILLKTYKVCAGKLNQQSRSGSLTPLGTFAIGNECAVYEEGIKGNFKNETRELISVYGKRWIPLGKEIANCTGSSKGLGLHGAPWELSPETGGLVEKIECMGTYSSGGCIRLLTEDIEELYAVIVSKPAYIHIVKDFIEAKVPGKDLAF
jgi:hypothetical protein